MPFFRLRFILLWLVSVVALQSSYALAPSPDPFDTTSAIVGRMAGGEFETPDNQHLTPAGKLVELPGMRPQAVAISPDQRLIVTSGKAHSLVVLEAGSGKILQMVDLPESTGVNPSAPASPQILDPDRRAQLSFTGLVFSPDGSRIYMANDMGDIKVFAVENGRVRALRSFGLPEANAPRRRDDIPAGIAVSADGKRLYVALNLSNRLIEMDASNGREIRVCDVGVDPYDVVLAGRKIYVSNWGGRRPVAGSLTGPGGRGTRVRVDPVHFVAAEGSVTVIDLDGVHETKEILTGLHACALALSPNGRYLAVANAASDTVSVIDTSSDKIVESICLRQNPADLFGAQPNALAFDKSGKTLYVCNGTQNAVAVVKFNPGQSRLDGLIPVGWFPGAIVFDSKHKTICVANIKGLTPGLPQKGGRRYNSMQWHGSLSFVAVPGKRRLAKMTQTALAGMRYPLLERAALPPRPDQPARPVPERPGEPSLLKHVIYVIKENRTYDQVLGDMPEGDGDPSLCVFGQKITPNEHAWSRQFVLLDNTYCCGSKSADGHQWSDSAIATDYMEKSYAGFPRSYPGAGDITSEDAMAYSPAGFIWDDAVAHGKSIRDFGEYTTSHRQWTNPLRKGTPDFVEIYHDLINGAGNVKLWSTPSIGSVAPFMESNTVGFDLNVPDQFRAAQFAAALKRFEAEGRFPDFMLIWLSSDHTAGTKPGAPTPRAMVADNDLALGKVLDSVSHSSFWKDTCVFVIEDDPQAGWDHVSGYRTTAYVAGPYVKHGQVIHTQYNQTSLLRTMELILGLPPMNEMDATATPMFDCFTSQPDFAPFNAAPNNIPLDEVNPEPKHISNRILRHDARVSAHLPFDKEDQCPEGVLNRIIWHATKGTATAYPEWAVKAVEDDD